MPSGAGKPTQTEPFWRTKPLTRLTEAEWESLCDRCGRCCLIKLEDADTGHVHYTNVACRLFDAETCTCGSYALRHRLVDGCVRLSPETLPDAAQWMPQTCAYRLLWEGKDLPDWHPLVTGNPDSTRQAGMALGGNIVPEWEVAEEDLEDHILPLDDQP